MNAKIDKFVNNKFGIAINKYCNSVWYIVTIGAVCILCHTLNIPVTGAALLTLIAVPAFLFSKNSIVILPVILLSGFVISHETDPRNGYYNDPYKLTILIFCAVCLIAALVFRFIYYKEYKTIFKRTYLTISIAVLSAVLLVGGMFAPLYHATGVIMSLTLSVIMFFPYSYILNCCKYEGKKTIDYFAFTMIAASVVIGAAVLKQYALYDFRLDIDKVFLKFGYAVSNGAAAIVLMAIPITFYMVYTEKYGFLYLIAVVYQIVVIAFTFSRASLIIAVPGTLIVGTALCFKKKTGRIGYFIAYGVMLAGAVILAVIFRKELLAKLSDMFVGDYTGSGRTSLWLWGLDLWKDNPILGVGLWYLPQVNIGHTYYNFHNTLVTYLSCCGIVGLAAYIYHRYRTVRLVFSAKLTAERAFVALSATVLILNSLLDVYMTESLYLMFYSVMLALIEADVNKVKTGNTEYNNTVTVTIKNTMESES